MHIHPTPIQIKNEVTKAMIERFGDMPSHYVSAMFDALDKGIRTACDEHQKLKEVLTNG